MEKNQLITAKQFLNIAEKNILTRCKVQMAHKLATSIELFVSKNMAGGPMLLVAQYYSYSGNQQSVWSIAPAGMGQQSCLDSAERFLSEWRSNREYPVLWLWPKPIVACKVNRNGSTEEVLLTGVHLRHHFAKMSTHLERESGHSYQEVVELLKTRFNAFLDLQNKIWERAVGPII